MALITIPGTERQIEEALIGNLTDNELISQCEISVDPVIHELIERLETANAALLDCTLKNSEGW